LHSLGPTVHSVFIFNTQVSFIELLRLILDDLGLTRQSDDKLTMIDILNAYLIERLKAGHIVTLLIDEAQNLCDEALEGLRLLSNLETDTAKLIQIVLMGQPELEDKLDHIKLRQLKQRITLHCRLAPLKKDEVGPYIVFRLEAAGYQGKRLFQSKAVEAIALYSKGIPRLVNIMCDNALLAAFARGKREISAEIINEVAVDLRLESQPAEKSSGELLASSPVRSENELSWLQEAADIPDDAWVSRLTPEHAGAAVHSLQRQTAEYRQGAGFLAAAIVGLITLAGAGATLYSPRIAAYFSRSATDIGNWTERSIDAVAGPSSAPKENPAGFTNPPTEPVTENGAAGETFPESPEALHREKQFDSVSVPRAMTKAPRKFRNAAPRAESTSRPELERKRMEAEVNKAIQNRAIAGVTVSVVDGTAYLDGRVASVRQKLMAEKAARSVAEVKTVRNRLSIGP
jgi:type II secretory pathway predicted ATPase ExeA